MIIDNQKISLQAIIFVVVLFYSVKQATSAAIGVPIDNGADQLMLLRAQVNDLQTKLDQHRIFETSSRLRLPPTSCRQLAFIGHNLNGIYLVANPDTNKIETVYCDFGTNLSETLYGSVALKSKFVHFFVQRSSRFALDNAVIPFETERLNEGGAMNLVTGIFTVPVDGIYHFEFTGIKLNDPTELRVFLQVNGVNIGEAYATNLPNHLSFSGIGSLRLKTGDQVRLYKTTGTIYDDVDHYTFFTGWLVEEDLMLST